MARIRFEKYNMTGVREKTITLPMFLLRIVMWMMPRSTLNDMAARGLDLRAAIEASRQGVFYRREFPIRERGVDKRLVVSLV